MRYLQKSFTLPVAQGVSKEEWDRIFNPKPCRECGQVDFHKMSCDSAAARAGSCLYQAEPRAEGRDKNPGFNDRGYGGDTYHDPMG